MNYFTTKFLNKLMTDGDLLKRFETNRSNQDRLEILHAHLRNEPGFFESLQKISSVQRKDVQRSLEAKNMGVRDFAAKRCRAALLKTNESLSLAPPDCDFLPHLFGNRSAICFDLRNYKETLVNIELALTHKIPELLKVKLLFRKAKCLSILKNAKAANVYEDCMGRMSALVACLNRNASEIKQYEDLKRKMQDNWMDLTKENCLISEKRDSEKKVAENFEQSVNIDNDRDLNFRLPSKNKKFPVASTQIILSTNSQFGRGVFADKDISPGQIVVLEEAVASVLRPSEQFRFTHCQHCLKRNPSRLVPCKQCDALFCNDHCRKASDESTHDVDCRVLPAVKQMQLFGIVEMLALRFVLREIRNGANINDLFQNVSRSENTFPDFASLVYQLETNEAGRKPSDMISRVFKSLILCYLLRMTNFFSDDSKHDFSSPFSLKVLQFGALLVHYFQVVACNAHDINTFYASPPSNDKGPYGDLVQIGSGLYPFCSMFNHSCDPNVVRHSIRGSSIMVSALKTIQKGEQLFDNYGCHYATMLKSERQKYLWEQYRFLCGCHACQNDYPIYQPDREETIRFIKHHDNKININNNNDNNNNNNNNNSNKNKDIDNVPLDLRDVNDTIRKTVLQSVESFNSILSEILNNGHQVSDLCRKLTIVKRHMELLDRHVERPHQEFEKAQETYKRILAYLTNCEFLEDGEGIPE